MNIYERPRWQRALLTPVLFWQLYRVGRGRLSRRFRVQMAIIAIGGHIERLR